MNQIFFNNRFFLKFLIILFVQQFLQQIQSKLQTDLKSRQLIDEFERKRLYHGVNVVVKEFPFYPNLTIYNLYDSLTDRDFQYLNEWGFNVIRLGVQWEGIEPERGQYNYTLLQKYIEIVEKAAQYNISVFLDAHQDTYNRKFCGEGIPYWTIFNDSSFPEPLKFSEFTKDEFGVPSMNDCLDISFSNYYFTFDVNAAFQNLYDNVDGVADKFASFWKLIAQNFKDFDNVIAYEYINEPWFGNIFHNPALILNSDMKNLLPFYQRLSKQIREVDNQTMIMFEPAVADYIKVGFTETPEGSDHLNRQILAFHSYCLKNLTKIKNLFCDPVDAYFFFTHVNKAEELGVASFLTEFGGIYNNDADLDNLKFIIENSEDRFISWAFWEYKSYKDLQYNVTGQSQVSMFNISTNTIQLEKVKTLARSYFYAICGEAYFTDFLKDSGELQLSFIYQQCLQEKNSEFYLSMDFYYKNGFSFTAQGCEGIHYQSLDVEANNNKKYYYELIVPSQCVGNDIQLKITSI